MNLDHGAEIHENVDPSDTLDARAAEDILALRNIFVASQRQARVLKALDGPPTDWEESQPRSDSGRCSGFSAGRQPRLAAESHRTLIRLLRMSAAPSKCSTLFAYRH
jgi:hypothetical protein